MIIRQALIEDIAAIQLVRNSVHENTLSDPRLVTDEDCREYLTQRGRGWVCQMANRVVGFSVVDLLDNNVWALFLLPEFEGQGIGRKLHDGMLEWYFSQKSDSLWLGTEPDTRAERFYRKAGWTEIGTHGKGEIKFEMTRNVWMAGRPKG